MYFHILKSDIWQEREEEINKLKDDVGEIKDLLHKILEKKYKESGMPF